VRRKKPSRPEEELAEEPNNIFFFRVDLPDSPPCIGLKYVDKEMLDGKDPIREDADNQARSKIREALEL